MKKILLVDDVEAIVLKRESFLSRAGFMILTATSGEEAITIHRTEKADLIIADLDMQGMNGDVLCSIIRRETDLRNVSVIILCYSRESDIERCEACGANAYITKPMDPQTLFRKVSEFLDVPARLSMRLLVQVRVKGKVEEETFFSTSKNVSSGGVLLETDKVFNKGDRIAASFFLGADQVNSNGEIIRACKLPRNMYQYGVRFVDMDSSSRDVIERYVDRLLRR